MLLFLFVATLFCSALSFPSLESLVDPQDLIELLTDLDGIENFGEMADPAPCCMPKQWQGMVKSLTGISGGRSDDIDAEKSNKRGKAKASTMMVYVDETNKRVAGKSICPVVKKEFFSFIVTFKSGSESGATVNIFNSTAQTCKTMTLAKAVFRDQCIPKDARFIGNLKIGALAGGLAVNSFVYNVTNKNYAMFGNSLVTPDACLPIISHAVGNVGRRFAGLVNFDIDDEFGATRPKPHFGYVSSSFFYDLQASITDPSVFTPPSYCPKAEGSPTMEKEQFDHDKIMDSLRWKTLF